MRLIPSKPWIKSNTLPFDDAAPIFFRGVGLARPGPVRGTLKMASIYMNLQTLDSSIQGSLGEAEWLTTVIEFEVAYIPDILPTTTMLGQTTSTRHNHYITKSTGPSCFSSRIEIIAHNVRGQAGRSGYEASYRWVPQG